MLELESGSNDPCAYMLTTIVLGIMSNQVIMDQYIYYGIKSNFTWQEL